MQKYIKHSIATVFPNFNIMEGSQDWRILQGVLNSLLLQSATNDLMAWQFRALSFRKTHWIWEIRPLTFMS